MSHRFYIVDVFAERPYAGNPLAVVIGAEGLSPATLQRLAAETNYSETTFVTPTPESDGAYRVRIFTPSREIAFAGHPILGSAWVIRHVLERGASGPVWLHLDVGVVSVSFETSDDAAAVAWFVAPPIVLDATCAADRIAPALGVSPSDIEPRWPVQRCSAGTAAMIVPLRGLEALARCRLDLGVYAPLAAEGFPPLVYLFCTETHHRGNDVSARFFFEAHGVREDPATGNGAAFLGAYLLEHRVFAQRALSLRIEQGHAMHRPSLIRVRARDDGAREVAVGGSVVPIVRGVVL